MNLTLKIWRQKGPEDKGRMVEYKVTDISEHMSFLEMMDVLNESLVAKDEEPIPKINKRVVKRLTHRGDWVERIM